MMLGDGIRFIEKIAGLPNHVLFPIFWYIYCKREVSRKMKIIIIINEGGNL